LNTYLRGLLFAGLVLTGLLSGQLNAQTIRSTGDGSWNDAATWDLNRVPESTDHVLIEHNVTLTGGLVVEVSQLDIQVALGFFDAGLTIDASSTLNVDGDVQATSNLIGSGSGLNVTIEGSLNVGGNLFITRSAGSIDGTMSFVVNSGFVNVPSGNVNLTDGGSSVFSNLEAVTLNGTAVMLVGGSLNITSDNSSTREWGIKVVDASRLTVEGDIGFGHNGFAPGSGLTLDVTDNGLVQLEGSFVELNLDGVVSFAQTATLELNGTGLQTLISSEGLRADLGNLVINKTSGGVRLQGNENLDVSGQLTLTQGIFRTGTGGDLVLANTASVVGGSNQSYVTGTLVKVGQDDFTFPLGANGKYRPFKVANIVGGNATAKASATYFNSSFEQDFFDITNIFFEITIDRLSQEDYWLFDYDAFGATYNFSLLTDSEEGSGITDPNNLLLIAIDNYGEGADGTVYGSTYEGIANGVSTFTSSTAHNPSEGVNWYFTLASNSTTENALGAPPSVSSINAFVGLPSEDEIELEGFGFSTDDTVYVGGIKANINDVSGGSQFIQIPQSANFGPVISSNKGAVYLSPQPFLTRYDAGQALDDQMFSLESNLSGSSGGGYTATADFNFDGNLDVVFAQPDANVVTVYLMDGSGNATNNHAFTFSLNAAPSNLLTGDYNNDGLLDIAVLGKGSTFSNIGILYNDPVKPGSFVNQFGEADQYQTIPGVPGELGVTFGQADFDQDGDIDFAVLGDGSSVRIIENQGNDNFIAASTNAFGGESVFDLVVNDFNVDGWPDLAVYEASLGSSILVVLNTKSGEVSNAFQTVAVNNALTGLSFAETLYSADFNNDGTPDLMVPFFDDPVNIGILLGDGSGNFGVEEVISVGGEMRALSIGNLDGDAFPDIAVVTNNESSANSIFVIQNNGGTWQEPIELPQTEFTPTHVLLSDVFNNDGKPDLIAPHEGGNLLFFENQALGNPPTAAPTDLTFPTLTFVNLQGQFTGVAGVNGYLVTRRVATETRTLPEDRVEYAVNDMLGNQRVVAVGTSTTFVDVALKSSVEYTYDVYAFNDSGSKIVYNTTTYLTANVTTQQSPNQADSLALQAIYDEMGGTGWTATNNWTTGNYGTWTGVSIEIAPTQLIDSLDVSGFGLTGTMTEGIGSFANLQYLDMSNNAITGAIPDTLGNIASFFAAGAPTLRYLDLSQNSFSGTIPASLGSQITLQYLDLSANNLEGPLPNALVGATVLLDTLILANNAFTEINDFSSRANLLNYLDLRNNALEFSDVTALAGTGNVGTLLFTPQAAVQSPVADTLVQTQTSLTLSSGLSSPDANNTYQWYKDAVAISGATGEELTLTDIEVSNAGVYTLTIKNTAPGIDTNDSLQTTGTTVTVSSLLADSAALVTLYDNTDGANWTNNTNWKTGTVDSWFGVTVENNSVTGLSLSGNNLSGQLPEALGNLRYLKVLELNNNNLDGAVPNAVATMSTLEEVNLSENLFDEVPDLSGLPEVFYVLLNDNLLDFGDLELYDAVPFATVAPQKAFNNGIDTTFQVGTPIEIDLAGQVNGSANQYQWYKDASPISGENAEVLDLGAIELNDAGDYYLEVTSTALPSLTMASELFKIKVSTLERDSTALVELYNATDGANWTNNTNWLTGTVNTWAGVTVTGNSVTTLSLPNNGLSGTLPQAVGSLQELTGLDLSNNNLSGTAPDTLATLDNIESLDFSANNLEGMANLSGLPNATSIDLSNNQLDFADLEVYDEIAYATINPQQPFNEGGDSTVQIGANFEIDLTGQVDGTANNYEWFKDGVAIPGETAEVLDLSPVGLDDAGDYFMQVSSTALPSLIMTTQAFQVTVSTLERDSTALVALYNATGGASWNNNTNWLSGTVDTWFGVTVTGNSVTGLNLQANGLDGILPEAIGSLQELLSLDLRANNLFDAVPDTLASLANLEALNLADNQLEDLIDLSGLANITVLDVSGNFFDFGGLEPNAGISGITYTPQFVQEQDADSVVEAGGNATIFFDLDGTSNSYQWYRNGDPLSGETNNTLVFPDFVKSDSGTYYAEATSALVPGLTITTANYRIDVSTLQKDSLALVALYNATDGPNWNDNSGWLTDEVANWYGVTVDNFSVTRVELSFNNLAGALPEDLGNLEQLAYMDLGSNLLLGEVPGSMSGLLALEDLYLNQNFIEGLPDFLSSPALSTLDVTENLLDFDDLEIYDGEGFIIFDPQQPFGQGYDTLVTAGDALVLDLSGQLNGSNNEYQWLLDGVSIPGATDEFLIIDPLDVIDAGTYELQVSSSALSGLLLVSEQFNVFVQPGGPSEADSLILVDLYNSTNGPNWTDNTNWLSGPIDTWAGITTDFDAIIGIELPSNNLTGTIPADVGKLPALQVLDLSNNALTGTVPEDLIYIPNLFGVDVSGNQLDSLPDFTFSSVLVLLATNNLFDFNDLEPYEGLDFVDYDPQLNFGNGYDSTVVEGDAMLLDFTGAIQGSANNYQWYKDGTAVSGATTEQLLIDPISLADSGEYKLEVTSTVLTGLTLSTETITLNTITGQSVVEADSLALVDLYNATDGPNWTDNSNWLSGPVDEWFGVTVGNDSVTVLGLGSNNLSGTVPQVLGSLQALTSLDLSSNNFSGAVPDTLATLVNLTELYLGANQLEDLPDLSGLTNLTTLDLTSNNFDFEDLEPYEGLGFVTYSPQEFFESGNDTTVQTRTTLVLDFSGRVNGSSNNYQWYKDGSAVAGQTTEILTIADVVLADSGEYQLQVTSGALSGLTLSSAPLQVSTLPSLTISESDSLALVDLYNGTDGANWTDNSNWLSGNADTWFGVTVGNDSVTTLALANNNLSGTLPEAVGSLQALTGLDLSNNSLSGTVPDTLTTLTQLSQLYLDGNNFNTVPDLSGLSNITGLDLSNNAFDFADLEVYEGLGFVTYSPQAKYGAETDTTVVTGTDLTIDLSGLVAGSANTYQWYKDGSALTGETTEILNLSALVLADSGAYELQVSSTALSSLTLTSEPINVFTVPGLTVSAADSTALVELYNGTDGANWTDNSNWLSGNIDTWFGITVANDSVTALALANNNLSGTLPEAVGSLQALTQLNLGLNNLSGAVPDTLNSLTQLTQLDLSSNNFTAAPNLGGLSNLTTLDLSNNLFDFADLEVYEGLGFVTYSPQQDFGAEADTTVLTGTTLTLDLSGQVDGSANAYQWFKDGSQLTGETEETLNLANIVLGDSGIYELQVTSGALSGLTLTSEPIAVSTEPGLTVTATDSTALVAIYNDTDGANWTDNSNWLSGNIDTWFGVTVNNNTVTRLELGNNNLSGALPQAIGSLQDLEVLDLSNNPGSGIAPDTIASLINLSELYLNGNNLEFITDLTGLSNLSVLDLSNNAFDFEDLELYNGLSYVTFSPQANFGAQADTTVQTGTDLTLDRSGLVGGSANNYQWFKDGTAIAGETAQAITLTDMVFADSGAYELRVTSTALSGLTLSSEPINVSTIPGLSVIAADSLALVAIYNGTDGPNWTNNSNWLSGNADTWQGVTVTNDTVTALDLSGNLLNGTLPEAIGALQGLQVLNLSDNDLEGVVPDTLATLVNLEELVFDLNNIESLPNLTGLNLTNLNVANNKLDFEDLEPYNALGYVTFSPQQDFVGAFDTLVQTGTAFTLDYTGVVQGSANNFQWFKDGSAISGQNAPAFTIDPVVFADSGIYELRVTSGALSGLTLNSGLINVSTDGGQSVVSTDSLALVAIYNSTGGTGWANNSQWLSGPVRNWFGVSIANDSVSGLDLAGNGLTGTLPEALGSLQGLQNLDLANNAFTGQVPDTLTTLPALSSLDLSGNELSNLPDFSGTALNSLSVADNLLNFGHLEPNAGIASFTYAPQALYSNDTLIVPATTTTLNLDGTTSGTGVTYQWFKNGTSLDGQTNAVLTFASVTLANAGTYEVKASHPVLTDLTLESGLFEVAPNSLQADSTALEALFAATNGSSWTNNTNWGTGPVSTWFGVTADTNRVVGVALPNNNLSGTIPPGLGSIEGLTSLDLSNNQLSGAVPDSLVSLPALAALNVSNNALDVLPDFSTAASLNSLEVGNNAFGFEDLEPNALAGFSSFTFANQANVGGLADTLAQLGSAVTFMPEAGGNNNIYQWFKDDVALPGQNNVSYTITDVDFADSGAYKVQITNTQVLGLTIEANPAQLSVSSLDRDSTALAAVYNATQGQSWVGTDNWTNGPVTTWEGVTVQNNTVTAVELPNVGVTGAVPANITEVSELTTLNLDGNNITQLPDLTPLTKLTDLNVANNQLVFGDLEPLTGIATLTYAPQDSVGAPIDTLRFIGQDFTFVANVSGSANTYQWFKGNDPIAGATGSTFTLSNLTLDDDGDYFVQVNTNLASLQDLTLNSRARTLKISSLRRDSLALVDLYNETGGPQWGDIDANWTTGPVSTWEGVIVQSDRVISLTLPSNNLVGDVPQSLADISELTSLNLSDNALTSLPDLSALSALNNTNVSGNALDFGDLEPNAGLPNFIYNNQAEIGTNVLFKEPAGSQITVSVGQDIEGQNNTYTWSKDGQTLEGEADETVNIPSVQRADMGFYSVQVENGLLPDLTLQSRQVEVQATASIVGIVQLSDGELPNDAVVQLLRITSEGGYDTIPEPSAYFGGQYLFNNAVLDDYVVIAEVDTNDYPGALPTYFGNSIFWEEADTLVLLQDTAGVNIRIEQEPEETETGDFSIAGTLEEDVPDDGRLMRRRRVKKATVSVRRRTETGRVLSLEDVVWVLFRVVQTDDEGEFLMRTLPTGTYRLNIQYPGVPMDPNSFTEFNVGTNEEDSAVVVEAVVEPQSIVVREVEVTGIFTPPGRPESIKLYPNPAQRTLFVDLQGLTESNLKLEVTTLAGATMQQNNLMPNTQNFATVDVEELPPGIYMVTLKDQNGTLLKAARLMISR